MREAAARWLPADVRRDSAGLWEARLSAADHAEVKRILAQTAPRPV